MGALDWSKAIESSIRVMSASFIWGSHRVKERSRLPPEFLKAGTANSLGQRSTRARRRHENALKTVSLRKCWRKVARCAHIIRKHIIHSRGAYVLVEGLLFASGSPLLVALEKLANQPGLKMMTSPFVSRSFRIRTWV